MNLNRGALNSKIVRTPVTQNVRESVFCKYSHRDCTQNCLEGYDYCIRHILEDKAAPFRQCAYVTKAGRKCPSAAPKLEKKEGYCAFHTKKALVARQRIARKKRQKETPDTLLEDLVVTASTMDSNHSMEPRRGKVQNDSIASRALDYASSSDSESEPLIVEHAWRDSGDSDAESIDSDQEDALKYAGVYTTEEVAQILRDKLIRLQALYIDQFKRLKHILLTKRKKYLQAQRVEKELYGSIKRYKNDPQQREKYLKLCAMKRYHKKFGIEAVMQRQATRRRMRVTEGMSHKLPITVKCSFVDDGIRCQQVVVPLSKYCQKHILHDHNQVLYRPCPFADSQCGRPVATLLGSPFCSLHQSLPSTSTFQNPAEEEVKLENVPNGKKNTEQGMETKPNVSEIKVEVDEDHLHNNSRNQDSNRSYPVVKEKSIKMEVVGAVADEGSTEAEARSLEKLMVPDDSEMVNKENEEDDEDEDAEVLR